MAGKPATLIKLLVVAAVLAGGAYLLLDATRAEVPVAQAKRGTATNIVYGSVKVLPSGGTQPLVSEFGGTVERTALVPNQRVSKGDELLQLDTRPVEFEIKAREILLEEGKDQVKQHVDKRSPAYYSIVTAEDALRAVQSRKAAGAVGEPEVKAAERKVEEAKAQYESDGLRRGAAVKTVQNQIEQLNFQKDKMTLKAPDDGTITEVFVQPNQQIGPGLVANMISNKRIVRAMIDGPEYSKIKLGQPARVKLYAFPDRTFNGKVAEIARSPDIETGRYQINLEMADAKPEELVAGLEGNAEIIIGQKPDAVLVPASAVNGTRIFVVRDGRVEARAVQVGFADNTLVEVTGGVEEGETVVVDLFGVADGDRVKPVQAK